ncbi:RNA polymerase, sigma subunit, SigV [Colwellia chukchiensis]|uniref:RNA polymerase, sigma subunit, SigV n=1 Tax=Colwellia chukchiensis TaxID=641665 RepID=A0A1H7HLT2_9GAMM|nr:sigma-70 family RNA polymerase sigma factor [Colwellia chukchiensis]SEK51274.1 RNA polymerase, sigma subunit, SigV [Colwellia chukchiensis]
MFERSDETLVKQALKGKKSAWITLVKRYEKNLYNYSLRMVNNPDDAMDLMQDVFLAVFRNLAAFRGDSPFKGWLFKIAHYRCIEFYRRRKPTQSIDDAPEQAETASDACPVGDLWSHQQANILNSALQILPLSQKLVVELKFFQHCTFDDIAQQLGISVNTAKSRLYSALDKLKHHLEIDHVK